MERVSVIDGQRNVVFIAPHAAPGDDINTGIVARSAAEAMQAYAVINNGWQRSDLYNYDKEQADCNNVNHLIDVPADEFLSPIIRFKNRILKKNKWCWLFYIHGVGNNACVQANDNSLSIIVGYGAGSPSSYTCKPWMKNLLIYKCNQYGWNSYEGKAGGKYAAWSKNNLCQFFRKHQLDSNTHAMQLEIIYDLRSSKIKAELCGECLADFIKDVTTYDNWDAPKSFKPKQF